MLLLETRDVNGDSIQMLATAKLNKYELAKLKDPEKGIVTERDKRELRETTTCTSIAGSAAIGLAVGALLSPSNVAGGLWVGFTMAAICTVFFGVFCTAFWSMYFETRRIGKSTPEAKAVRKSDQRLKLLEETFEKDKQSEVWQRFERELTTETELAAKLERTFSRYLTYSADYLELLAEPLSDEDSAKVQEQLQKLLANTTATITAAINDADEHQRAVEFAAKRQLEIAEQGELERKAYELTNRVQTILMVNGPLVDEIGSS